MATVNIILFTSKKLKNDEHPIVLRVTKDRIRKYCSLGFSCKKEEWISSKGDVGKFTSSVKNYKQKNKTLQKQLWKAEEIISEFEADEFDWTLDDFIDKFVGIKSKGFYDFFETRIEDLTSEGKIGNANAYKTAMNAMKNFNSTTSLRFNQINYSFLKKFESHLRKKGDKDTTISVYMRTIRAVFNRAIKEKICKPDYYPFKEYQISQLNHTTKKRALQKVDIEKVFDFEPDPNTKQLRSKHIFMFSFYNMGMNFKDIALLKWDNIENGRLNYRRAKTGKDFTIKILPPVLEILNFYKEYNRGNLYIFPILDESYKTPTQIHNRIKRALKTYNGHLKIVAKQVGISSTLTSYVSRHSWATILKRKGVSTSVISEGLGHSNEGVTQTYLDSFENETLDSINELLL